MKSFFIKATPLVAGFLALFAFGMLGLVAYLQRDWIKGAMVITAITALVLVTRPVWKRAA